MDKSKYPWFLILKKLYTEAIIFYTSSLQSVINNTSDIAYLFANGSVCIFENMVQL